MSLAPHDDAYAVPLDESAPLVAPLTNQAVDPFPEAKWIWSEPATQFGSSWAWFRCQFDWKENATPVYLSLSADTRYRLYINQQWAGDGPVRGWPQHWYYDRRDVSKFLLNGQNEIRALVHYYGTSTFHTIPQRPGFIACLEHEGKTLSATGIDWHSAQAPEWLEAPDISIQMPPGEIFDARLVEEPDWTQPYELERIPWKGLSSRDVRETVVRARKIDQFREARELQVPQVSSVELERLVHPSTLLQAVQKTRACALATTIEVHQFTTVEWLRGDFVLYIDGKKQTSDQWVAQPGTHFAVAVYPELHSNEHAAVLGTPRHGICFNMTLHHPTNPTSKECWALLVHPDYHYVADDLHWFETPPEDMEQAAEGWKQVVKDWGESSQDGDKFTALCHRYERKNYRGSLITPNPDAEFKLRQLGQRLKTDELPKGGWKIDPSSCGVELTFDLEGQFAGFHEIEVEAPAGTIIDVSILEYVDHNGIRQHTTDNWNGFRYITREGRQRFTTRTRRSGRYLFISFRNHVTSVTLYAIQLRESIFPVESQPYFECSDSLINKVWKAAVRTMELSMDDVYIDSLYEQTLWVGDARNEQLYALTAWDARDISLRSLRLAAQSLERLPMVGSQVPSCWDTVIPVWSFLWVIAVWEYYAYSGEQSALEELWPAVMKNLRGAAMLLNKESLFEATTWNLFEWADSDFNHPTVIYNSLFLVGALQAAIKCAKVLKDDHEQAWLKAQEKRIRQALGSKFDKEKGLYPEALRNDGSTTEKVSIHPQFLAVLFAICEPVQGEQLLDKVASQDSGLVQLASPFAFQFYAEAFEKLQREDHVIEKMREFYAPMVNIGDTLWEALPGSLTSPQGFPTRSHCHGWSCAPLDLLPRIILGLRQVELGKQSYVCSPQPHGLHWAKGTCLTPMGSISVEWKIVGMTCQVELRYPSNVEVNLQSNQWLKNEGLSLREHFS